MKTFDEQEFISDLNTLLLNIVYSSDDPEEQLEYFNSMFKACLESNAPLQRVHYNRRNKLRKEAHQTGSQESWELFRDVRTS